MPAAGSEFARNLCASRVVRFSGDLNSDQGPFQCYECAPVVHVLAATRDALFGTLVCAHGTLEIDLVCGFRCLGKEANVFRLTVDDAPSNGAGRRSIGPTISDSSTLQSGEHRR